MCRENGGYELWDPECFSIPESNFLIHNNIWSKPLYRFIKNNCKIKMYIRYITGNVGHT